MQNYQHRARLSEQLEHLYFTELASNVSRAIAHNQGAVSQTYKSNRKYHSSFSKNEGASQKGQRTSFNHNHNNNDIIDCSAIQKQQENNEVSQFNSQEQSHVSLEMAKEIAQKTATSYSGKKIHKANNPPRVLRMKSAWIPSLNNQVSQGTLLDELQGNLGNLQHRNTFLCVKQNSFNSSNGASMSRQINRGGAFGKQASLLTHYQHINPAGQSDSHSKVMTQLPQHESQMAIINFMELPPQDEPINYAAALSASRHRARRQTHCDVSNLSQPEIISKTYNNQEDGGATQFTQARKSHQRTDSQTSLKSHWCKMAGLSTKKGGAHQKNKISSTAAKKPSVVPSDADIENVEQAVQQFGIIYNRESTAMSRQRVKQALGNASKHKTANSISGNAVGSQGYFNHFPSQTQSKQVCMTSKKGTESSYLPQSLTFEEEYQIKLQKLKERQQRLKYQSIYRATQANKNIDNNNALPIAPFNQLDMNIIVDGVKFQPSQGNKLSSRQHIASQYSKLRTQNKKRQERFKELMNQCVQANFDNNTDAVETSSAIGAHLLHIPQVMDNNSSAEGDFTERPYDVMQEFVKVEPEQEQMFNLCVELSSKRDCSIRIRDQVLSSTNVKGSQILNSGVSKYVYPIGAYSSTAAKKQIKGGDFASPRPFCLAETFNEGLASHDNKISNAAKQTSPIKKWLSYSKVQKQQQQHQLTN